jgi:hypothetical protein
MRFRLRALDFVINMSIVIPVYPLLAAVLTASLMQAFYFAQPAFAMGLWNWLFPPTPFVAFPPATFLISLSVAMIVARMTTMGF